LDAYPELENVLFELSPAFSKLKNPILRKTVARIATLQQAAVVGKLRVEDLINRLRKEVGQKNLTLGNKSTEDTFEDAPSWFDDTRITIRYDATPVINSGNSPMAEILTQASLLSQGQIFELITPFIPAPIIDKLEERGFETYSLQKTSVVINYICKKTS